ncbi:CinA family protein [Microbacterium sp. NPDC078428]|uniref:CinA family protein n=1 Tax=Microbacterium sp. NPDC078428 TaxID=3364190 RepID=UPI0037C6041D
MSDRSTAVGGEWPPCAGEADVHGEAALALSRLRARGWSLGVAESLTGGLLAAALIGVPGASDTVRGAIVAYAVSLKHSLLGVDAGLLAAHGAVHPDVALQMAEGVRRVTAEGGRAADVGIATTGIAGPDSPDGQPVGTVHLAICTPGGSRVVSLRLDGDRDEIREATVRHALWVLVDAAA